MEVVNHWICLGNKNYSAICLKFRVFGVFGINCVNLKRGYSEKEGETLPKFKLKVEFVRFKGKKLCLIGKKIIWVLR